MIWLVLEKGQEKRAEESENLSYSDILGESYPLPFSRTSGEFLRILSFRCPGGADVQ